VSEEADGRLRRNDRKKVQVGGVSRSALALLLVLDWSLHPRGSARTKPYRKTCQSPNIRQFEGRHANLGWLMVNFSSS
jgi:hypothetical protein